jgi:hypothetical protein
MELHPQDVAVVLKFVAVGLRDWTYAKLAEELAMSPSQVFQSVQRAEIARLLQAPSSSDSPMPMPSPPPDWKPRRHPRLSLWPNRANLKEFLVHGVKYSFPADRGGLVRGMPTAHAAPPFSHKVAQSFEPPPVWPWAEGSIRGTEFSPLYKKAPEASQRDPKLYELLVLVDAIRDGRAREQEIAVRELTSRIDGF